MQRIKGQELGPLWDHYSGEEKEAISSQLKTLVSQYRAIKPCDIAVGSADYPKYDNELFDLEGVGPFKDLSAFQNCGSYDHNPYLPNTVANSRISTRRETSPPYLHMVICRLETVLSETTRS